MTENDKQAYYATELARLVKSFLYKSPASIHRTFFGCYQVEGTCHYSYFIRCSKIECFIKVAHASLSSDKQSQKL